MVRIWQGWDRLLRTMKLKKSTLDFFWSSQEVKHTMEPHLPSPQIANRVINLHNQTPFNAFRIGCLVDRKGQASNLSSLVVVPNQRKHYTISLSFVLIETEECCNRTRDVVRDKYKYVQNSIVSE